MTLVYGSLQLGLIYGLLALGVYITFRILNLPDLTVDGSFTLGMAVTAVLTLAGHPGIGLLLGTLCGALAGIITGLLQTKAGIHPILAGILTMTGLYSVNLVIMGNTANLSLIGANTLFTASRDLFSFLPKEAAKLLPCFVASALAFLLLAWFFQTSLGLSLRATGSNEAMVRSSSISVDFTKCFTLALGNACVALAGGLIGQYQMFADMGSGTGMVVVGLASVIIGEVCFGRRSVTIGLASAVCGAIVYRFILALALKSSFFPASAFKLLSAVIVALALSLPAIRRSIARQKQKRRATHHA